MTNEKRFADYKKEICVNCKNPKENNLCNVKISTLDDIVLTRCIYYEKKDKSRPLHQEKVQ